MKLDRSNARRASRARTLAVLLVLPVTLAAARSAPADAILDPISAGTFLLKAGDILKSQAVTGRIGLYPPFMSVNRSYLAFDLGKVEGTITGLELSGTLDYGGTKSYDILPYPLKVYDVSTPLAVLEDSYPLGSGQDILHPLFDDLGGGKLLGDGSLSYPGRGSVFSVGIDPSLGRSSTSSDNILILSLVGDEQSYNLSTYAEVTARLHVITSAVPEPGALAATALGGLMILGARRVRRRRRAG